MLQFSRTAIICCLALYYFFTFSVSLFYAKPLYAETRITKPVSLIVKSSFGSEPYKKLSKIDRYILATGKGDTVYDPSPIVDLLLFEGSNTTLIKTFDINELLSDTDKKINYVLGVAKTQDSWIIVADNGQHVVMNIAMKNDQLYMRSMVALDSIGFFPKLHVVDNEHIYVLNAEYNTPILISHLKIGENGELNKASSKIIEKKSTRVGYSQNVITTAYDNHKLVIGVSDADSQASFYQVTLDDLGVIQEHIVLDFPEAGAEYRKLLFKDNILYLSKVYREFEIAELADNSVSLSYSSGDNLNWFSDFKLVDSTLYAADTFNGLFAYDISNSSNPVQTAFIEAKTYVESMEVDDTHIFLAKLYDGMEVFQHKDEKLSSINQFSRSGKVTGLTLADSTVVSAAYRNAVNIWDFSDNSIPLLSRFDMTGNGVAGVGVVNGSLLIQNGHQITRHNLDNVLDNINAGEYVANVDSGFLDSEIITLDNGFLVQNDNMITFYNQGFTQLDTIEYSQLESDLVQKPLAKNGLLFVPVNVSPRAIEVYDISDLSDVKLLTSLVRDDSRFLKQNLAIKDNVLFVAEPVGPQVHIAQYDFSDSSNIVKLLSFDAEVSINNKVSLHIYNNYLAVIANESALFDIADVNNPMLMGKNVDLSSNGVSISDNADLYVVKKNSSGHIQHAQINLAPTHNNLTIELEEDTPVSGVFDAKDSENDLTLFYVLTQPENGELSINDDKYTFQPEANSTETQHATLFVNDIHGNASQFTLELQINPVNDSPEIGLEKFTTDEDIATTVDLNVTDVDSTELSASITSAPENGELIIDNLQLRYVPASNFNGEDSFTIAVTDDLGAVTEQVISVKIDPVNDFPLIPKLDYQGIEDVEFIVQLTAQDVDGDTVTFVELDESHAYGQLTLSVDGKMVITPVADFNGDVIVDIAFEDAHNARSSSQLKVIFSAVDDAPSNSDATFSIQQDGNQVQQLPKQDSDGESLSYEVVNQSQFGSVTLASDGQYTYTPNAGYSGADSFTYRVTDTSGNSVEATITVNVRAKVTPPAAKESGGGSMGWWLIVIGLLVGARISRHH